MTREWMQFHASKKSSVADKGCLHRIPGQKDPGSEANNLSIFSPKNSFSAMWSEMFIPDPDFFLNPGSRPRGIKAQKASDSHDPQHWKYSSLFWPLNVGDCTAGTGRAWLALRRPRYRLSSCRRMLPYRQPEHLVRKCIRFPFFKE